MLPIVAQTEAARPSLGAGGFKTTKLNFKQLKQNKQQGTKENQMQGHDRLQKEQKPSCPETQMD